MGKVIDFGKKRKQFVERKRLSLEELVFKNFLGVYLVLSDDTALYKVRPLDISYDGIRFDIPLDSANSKKIKEKEKRLLSKGTQLNLRFYFTDNTYVPACVMIKHREEIQDQDGSFIIRYGGEFDQSSGRFMAIDAFIRFLYKFAEHSMKDNESQKVYFL